MRKIACGLTVAALLTAASCANQEHVTRPTDALAAAAPATVKIATGELQGLAVGGIVSFKGIPYAVPPVGDNRWRAPQPATAWQGVRAATEYGNDCQQKRAVWDDRGRTNAPMSEDCLTLNVWTPSSPVAGGAPVMVWLHGGGFTTGNGAQGMYDGTRLAQRGLVIVTINYRLGRLGFFAHPALTAEAGATATGNFGLMDQVLALKWVRDNITAFGGDPNRVTIAGESAGGGSVNQLMIIQDARGLFQRAISQSGGSRDRTKSQAEAEQVGIAFAKRAGAPDATAAALRALSTDTANGNLDDQTYTGVFNDGKFVTSDVDTAFAAGKQAPVPYMAGNNDYEIGMFPQAMRGPLTAMAKQRLGDTIPALEQAYGSKDAMDRTVMQDAMFTEPARFQARHASAHGSYLYQFAYVPENLRPTVTGAPHTGDIFYVFGNLQEMGGNMQDMGAPATAADRAEADLIGDYWADFMRTGNPNGGSRPIWPAYIAGGSLMRFDAKGAAAVTANSPALDIIEAYQEAHRPSAR